MPAPQSHEPFRPRRLPPSHPISRPKSLEGFWRPGQVGQSKAPQAARGTSLPSEAGVSHIQQATESEIVSESQKRRFGWLVMPSLALAGMTAGFLVQALFIGQILLLVYAVWVWWRQVPSRTTFGISLMTFAATVIFFSVHQNGQLAQNFAVYTFWLVVIGTISMVIEIRSSQRANRQARQR